MNLPDCPKTGVWDDSGSFHDLLLARSRAQDSARRRGRMASVAGRARTWSAGLRPVRSEVASILAKFLGVSTVGLASALLWRERPPVTWAGLVATLGFAILAGSTLSRRLARPPKPGKAWASTPHRP